MAEFQGGSKRKDRGSDSDETKVCSPEGKKAYQEANEKSVASETSGEMSKKVEQQLKLILERLESAEEKMVGFLEKFGLLEKTVYGVKRDIQELQSETKTLKTTVKDIEASLAFKEAEVDTLRKEIKELKDIQLYKEVYNKRENLWFLDVPEVADENTSDVLHRVLEDELQTENASQIEFQRVHRLGKKTDGSTWPIIARFLRFPDHERIFQKAMELKNESDVRVKVYTDFPKEIQDRRKKQWPKLKRAREDGKTAFFSKQEPDKLFIDGIFIPFA